MSKRIVQKLESLQLQHWMRAVDAGKPLTQRNPKTNETVTLNLPLAKTDGNGLTFTLSKSGTASWILRFRFGGRARELTLGNYPDISLNNARALAREKRAQIDRGIDPASEKVKLKSLQYSDMTVRNLSKDYQAKVLQDLSISTQRSYKRNLLRIENRIGSLGVSQVTSIDLVLLVETSKLPWVEANMLLCAAKMLFKHAVGKRLISVNPCSGVQLSALMGKRPAIRQRLMLTKLEILELFKASMSRENLLTVKILLGTAVRSGELFSAKWCDINLIENIWSIPKTKTGRGIQIPLTDCVVSWFKELQELALGSAFVLPARKERRRLSKGGDASINPNTFGEAIQYWIDEHNPPIRRFTPHDLRSTAKSHLRALGVPRDITEMCLNHKLPGVEGVYDLHTYFDERRNALVKMSEFLLEIEMQVREEVT